MEEAYEARFQISNRLEPRFPYLLDIANGKLCFDPRDRVYAMLGMSGKVFRGRINVSYSLESGDQGSIQTYISCATTCIEDSDPMILKLVSGRKYTPGLPSWCPNLNSTQASSSFGDHVRAGILGGELRELAPKSFRGKIIPGCNKLTVNGFQVDIVSEVVEPAYPSPLERPIPLLYKKILKFEAQSLALAQKTASASPDTIPMDHIFTLGVYTHRRMRSTEGDNFYQAYLDTIVHLKSIAQGQRGVQPPREREPLFHEVWTWLNEACPGRRYFSTENGRVGLGPQNIRKGDKICVFSGAGPVFALREVEERIGEWQLVGDAFVHGLMELSETPQSARSPDEDFIII